MRAVNSHVPETTLSKRDIGLTLLVILSFVLLPFGRMVEIPTILLALSGLLLLFKRQYIQLGDKAIRLFFIIFLTIWLPMLISSLDSVETQKSVIFTLKYLRFLMAGVLTIAVLRQPVLKKWVLNALVAVVVFWIIDSVVQWLMGVDLLGREYGDSNRLTGPFKKLIMPVYLTVLLPLVCTLIDQHSNRYILFLFIATSFGILCLAGSRASVLVLLLGVIFYLYLIMQKKFWVVLAGIMALLLTVGYLGYSYSEVVKERIDRSALILQTDYQSVNTATAFRLPIWEAAYKAGLSHPINGVGVRTFRNVYHDYDRPENHFQDLPVSHPHLFFLEVFSETGAIGLVFFLVLWCGLYLYGIKKKGQLNYIQSASLVTILIAFFPLNAHVSLYGSHYSQLAWLMTAIASVCLLEPRGRRVT